MHAYKSLRELNRFEWVNELHNGWSCMSYVHRVITYMRMRLPIKRGRVGFPVRAKSIIVKIVSDEWQKKNKIFVVFSLSIKICGFIFNWNSWQSNCMYIRISRMMLNLFFVTNEAHVYIHIINVIHLTQCRLILN